MSLALQMRDYRLTTAEILYHMPDHPAVLQSYVWQSLDLAPKFPDCGNSWISGPVRWTANYIPCASAPPSSSNPRAFPRRMC